MNRGFVGFDQEVYVGGAYKMRRIYINPENVTSVTEEEEGYVQINSSGGLRDWVQVKGDIKEVVARLQGRRDCHD